MLFTSSIFLYVFLPVFLILFFTLAKIKRLAFLVIPLLIVASFVFYGYKDQSNILLLLISVLTNYSAAYFIRKTQLKTLFFWLGVFFNLGLLFYFKYINFFFMNVSTLTGQTFGAMDIALPLAISFYTFQQIAYLADTKKGLVKNTSLKNYLLFVTFFPQLIIGPIVHHSEMMPQFKDKQFGRFSFDNFKTGFFFLFAGLCKKLFLSDYCAQIVDAIHTDIIAGTAITFADAWASAFAFSFQIYFDFSGYTDMAIGIAYMMGICLPINFNSPYKSRNVADFWRRWHMTLSRWLRDYLYIPLGGNSKGTAHAAANALIVFLLGGLWHGAAWTFVLWGLMQGAGIVAAKCAGKLKIVLPLIPGIALTFLFVTLSWVLFRAVSLDAATNLYAVMFGQNGFDLTLRDIVKTNALILLSATVLTFVLPNTNALVPKLANWTNKIPVPALATIILVVWLSLAAFDLDSSAEFIYFDF